MSGAVPHAPSTPTNMPNEPPTGEKAQVDGNPLKLSEETGPMPIPIVSAEPSAREDPSTSPSSTLPSPGVSTPETNVQYQYAQDLQFAYYQSADGFEMPSQDMNAVYPGSQPDTPQSKGKQSPSTSGSKENANNRNAARFDSSKCKTLYVGNLHPFVTDELLRDAFAQIGPVEHAKVMKDKKTGMSTCYGFVGFAEHKYANLAVQNINGRMLYGQDVKVNWAFHGNKVEDTSTHYHVFVGDLSSEVDDTALYQVFSMHGSCSDARVMWDQHTGRSRGYGFVAFRDKDDAERSMKAMNGEFVGGRRVRCGWANQRGQQDAAIAPLDFEAVERGADPGNTNVYVGNLSPAASEAELRGRFEAFGPVAEIRHQREKGFGFVIFQRHEDAVRAIVGMTGQTLGGKAVKCAWGRSNAGSAPPASPQQQAQAAQHQQHQAQQHQAMAQHLAGGMFAAQPMQMQHQLAMQAAGMMAVPQQMQMHAMPMPQPIPVMQQGMGSGGVFFPASPGALAQPIPQPIPQPMHPAHTQQAYAFSPPNSMTGLAGVRGMQTWV